VGLGLTVTKARKAFIADRRPREEGGPEHPGAGVMLDFASSTYRRVPGAAAAGAVGSSPGGEEGGKEREREREREMPVDAAVAAEGAALALLPGLWHPEGVNALLEAALADPAAHWGVLATLTQALLREAAALLVEQVGGGWDGAAAGFDGVLMVVVLGGWWMVECVCVWGGGGMMNWVDSDALHTHVHTHHTSMHKQPPRVPIPPYSREGASLYCFVHR
jgi:hypothetical protein